MTIELSDELTDIDLTRTYTLDEFFDLDLYENGEFEYELVEGKLVPRNRPAPTGPSALHGRIANNVGYYLKVYAREQARLAGTNVIGQVFNNAPTILGTNEAKGRPTYVLPDACYVASGRLPGDFAGPIALVPDLVVEVNSPSDNTQDIHDKLVAYRRVGVPLIWSIYMLEKFVVVYDNGKLAQLFNLEDELKGGATLPGFGLKVSALFE